MRSSCDRPPAREAGGRSATPESVRDCVRHGERMVSARKPASRAHVDRIEGETRPVALDQELKRPCGRRQFAGGRGTGRLPRDAESPSPRLSVPRACEHARQQSVKVLLRQHCKLQQARVQPLEFALRHGVEIDATNALIDARALQPTEKNLGSTGIRDRALTQTTLDLCVRRWFPRPGCCADPLLTNKSVAVATVGELHEHSRQRVGPDDA